ncbi:MAG: PqqD family protein [Chloroflexi bacterium]|nr:PqqD family protein [Chloroflexota bacterium]MBU1751914.1 PqqD family protein [Chloroflexota bacterium]
MEPNGPRPRRRVGLIRQELRGQTYLYDTREETVHILNPTAGLVWDLCTGEHTPDLRRTVR